MKKTIIFIAFLTLVIAACNKDAGKISQDKKILSGSNYMPIINMLYSGQTSYSSFLETADFMCGYISHSSNPLANNIVFVPDSSPSFNVFANSLVLASSTNYNASQFSSLFGNTVTFQVGDTAALYFNLYIPQIIQITSPPITTTADLLPFCYYNQMQISWNADQNNPDGILVAVEWNGAMYEGDRVENTLVRNVDIIANDNGATVLDNDMFLDIPDLAIATLYLIRGKSAIYEIQNSASIKLGGASIAELPIVVIKDMSNYSN
jgi:hypothetical protein